MSLICLESALLRLLHQPLSSYWYTLAPWPQGQINSIDWRRAGTRAGSADWPGSYCDKSWSSLMSYWLASKALCIPYSSPPLFLSSSSHLSRPVIRPLFGYLSDARVVSVAQIYISGLCGGYFELIVESAVIVCCIVCLSSVCVLLNNHNRAAPIFGCLEKLFFSLVQFKESESESASTPSQQLGCVFSDRGLIPL